jgi:hypothetical protein
VFADLSGVTEFTEQRGDQTAVLTATSLQRQADAVAAGRGGRVVKLLGDGALLRFSDARSAVEAALELVETVGRGRVRSPRSPGSPLPAATVVVRTGVRYQLWHVLGLFAVVLVPSLRFPPGEGWFAYAPLVAVQPFQLWPALAGWLFVTGVALFCGSLEARGGEILVSPLVRQLTEPSGAFTFGDPTDVELKGLSGMHRLSSVRWQT